MHPAGRALAKSRGMRSAGSTTAATLHCAPAAKAGAHTGALAAVAGVTVPPAAKASDAVTAVSEAGRPAGWLAGYRSLSPPPTSRHSCCQERLVVVAMKDRFWPMRSTMRREMRRKLGGGGGRGGGGLAAIVRRGSCAVETSQSTSILGKQARVRGGQSSQAQGSPAQHE